MNINKTSIPNLNFRAEMLSSVSRLMLVALLLISAMMGHALSQNIKFTQGNVGSGLENRIQVPLGSYPGRGAVSVSVTLAYSSRIWRIGPVNSINNNLFTKFQTITEAIYSENSVAGWKSSIDLPIIEWPRNEDTYYYTGKPFCDVCGSNLRQFRVARVFVNMPDGAKHELRKSDQPYEGPVDMVGTFYAVDGSRLRYDSTGQNTGTLFLPDGTRFQLNGSTAKYIDRNGNTLNYDNATRQWTDSLDRAINLPLPANPVPGEQLYSLPGMPLPYKFIWKHLSEPGVLTALANGSSPTRKPIANDYLPFPNLPPTAPNGNNFPIKVQTNYSEIPSLFISSFADDEDLGPETIVLGRGQIHGELFDPVVLTEIVLPNNLRYKFTYNIYGEIDKVVYPTGSFDRYQYSQVPAFADMKAPYTEASRGVTLRQVSANGSGNDLVDWAYEAVGGRVSITAPQNEARVETYRTIIPTPVHPGAQGTESTYWPFGFEDARQGQIYEQRVYAPGPGGAMLRRTLTEFAQTSNIVQPSIPSLDNTTKTAYRNLRPVKEVSLVLDTGGDALSKTVNYEYTANNYELTTGLDRTASEEYQFRSVAPTVAQADPITTMLPGTLASRVETIYLDDPTYQSRHILGLESEVSFKGIINQTLQTVAKSKNFYDEYALVTYNDLSPTTYIDPATPARGNLTTIRRYVDITAGSYLDTHAKFDQCGNVTSFLNARGIESEVQFSPDYKHAFPTQKSSAIPDESGAHGSNTALVSRSTFDITTGLPLETTDENNQITSLSYKDDQNVTDPLIRLRKVTRPDGGWTKYTFGDTVGNLYTLTETKRDTARISQSMEYIDPMGRLSRSFASEADNNYIVTDTIYDLLGRVWKVSNPYRTTTLNGVADIGNTDKWTVTNYDSLGRVNSVTLPDGSVSGTSYQGVYTTFTDQAGKQRRHLMDALGRLVRVDEPNLSGNLGSTIAPTQPTYYEYDPQGNLVRMTQGVSPNPVQHRYFKYDALSRLTYEHQVEQVALFSISDPVTGHNTWSRKLVYDETIGSNSYSGLLTSAYDARNVQTQFLYDNLNRIYQINYSDGTPTVTNYYDQIRNPYHNKGCLTEARTAAVGSIPATSELYNFDLMGRVKNHVQTIGDQPFTMNYTYDLGGALISQTYPSGRTVSYSFDNASRLSQVASGTTVYANQFDYSSSSGLLKAVTFGSGAVESYVYNSRQQLQSLDVIRNATQLHHFEYKFGLYNPATNTVDESKNTGEIAYMEGFVNSAKKWQQGFTYDTLGRLSSARELRGDNGLPSYIINYEYDLFGNRYQKQSQNGGNPFPQVWVEDNQIDQATNRFNTGVSYDNSGNITVDAKFRNRKYDYDANNRLKQSRNLNDTNAIDSVFDAGGQRVATQGGGSLTNVFVYDAMGKLVAEYSQAVTTGGTQYVFSDHQGSPRAITNNQGNVIARHDYLPFGEDIPGTLGLRNGVADYGGDEGARQKYAAMEKDDSTGMAHTLWRKYDSSSGRWTTTDPDRGSMLLMNPQTLNAYTYVTNSPVNFVDPLGLRLADMGVVQTDDPAYARTLQGSSDAEFRHSINGDYAVRNNLAVSERTIGDVTRYQGSPAAPTGGGGLSSGFFNPFEVWFEGHFDSEGYLVWEDSGLRYCLPPIGRRFWNDPTNSDPFRNSKESLVSYDMQKIDPASVPDYKGLSVSVKSWDFSLTRSRHGHWFLGLNKGANVSWPLPISISGYSGECYTDILHQTRANINDPNAIDQVIEGTSISGSVTLFPTESISGSLNTNRWTGVPTGSGTLGTGWSTGFGGSAGVGRSKRIY